MQVLQILYVYRGNVSGTLPLSLHDSCFAHSVYTDHRVCTWSSTSAAISLILSDHQRLGSSSTGAHYQLFAVSKLLMNDSQATD